MEHPLGGGANEVWACIKAEDVARSLPGVARALQHPNVNHAAAIITATSNLGVLSKVELDCGFRLNANVMTRQLGAMELVPGGRVEVGIPSEAIHLLSRPSSAPD